MQIVRVGCDVLQVFEICMNVFSIDARVHRIYIRGTQCFLIFRCSELLFGIRSCFHAVVCIFGEITPAAENITRMFT